LVKCRLSLPTSKVTDLRSARARSGTPDRSITASPASSALEKSAPPSGTRSVSYFLSQAEVTAPPTLLNSTRITSFSSTRVVSAAAVPARDGMAAGSAAGCTGAGSGVADRAGGVVSAAVVVTGGGAAGGRGLGLNANCQTMRITTTMPKPMTILSVSLFIQFFSGTGS
jgi:hypothetical protein